MSSNCSSAASSVLRPLPATPFRALASVSPSRRRSCSPTAGTSTSNPRWASAPRSGSSCLGALKGAEPRDRLLEHLDALAEREAQQRRVRRAVLLAHEGGHGNGDHAGEGGQLAAERSGVGD